MAEVDKLLRELQKSLDKAQKDTAVAEKRRAIALSEANNLENRNRLALQSLNDELATKRVQLLGELDGEIAQRKSSIARLDELKLEAEAQLAALGASRVELMCEVEAVRETLNVLTSDKTNEEARIADIAARLAASETALMTQDQRREELSTSINELSSNRQRRAVEAEALERTLKETQDKLTELDTTFGVRSETYNKQLVGAEQKLQTLLDRIQQAMNKDRQIRESWADGHRDLDKRENSVRRMESRLAGAEDRIKELDTYI